ncbi:hypothetical protein A0H81_08019 [Grifola frondosa]|uniref:Arrestin-like N-terminal domain-containing protein n=1 Tax=Grifola frondosa TaxID=5627 RepID=A0A1C7M5P3_GRIFR|nr:hypothetical protein A0H81_08019 [Grifola frondosa]
MPHPTVCKNGDDNISHISQFFSPYFLSTIQSLTLAQTTWPVAANGGGTPQRRDPAQIPDILDPELPSYSQNLSTVWDIPPVQTEHSYYLTKKARERWLSLTVRSRATNDEELPTFFQGGVIAGSLKLNLEKEDVLVSVYISVVGRLTIFAHSASNFLNISKLVWSAATPPEQSSESPCIWHSGKLKGHYEWPFSLRLPKGVSIMSSIEPESSRTNFRLPPSFSDRLAGVKVEYTLKVRVNRSGLRAGDKLVVPITYIPLLRPSPPSIARQIAYQENSPLIGPGSDPGGWKVLKPVTVEGTMFRTKDIEAKCRLSLAKPLCYTRGTPLHLILSVESADPQFLDLLSNHSITVCLCQRNCFKVDAALSRRTSDKQARLTVKSHNLATAVWWRSSGDNPATRIFAGELQIPEKLTPPCDILNFGVNYEVILYPFHAVGFTTSLPSESPLLSVPVEIVTAFAQGPHPRVYSPPQYDGEIHQPHGHGFSVSGMTTWF